MTRQIRGGNASTYRNGEYLTDTSSGCPRLIKLRAYDFQPSVSDPKTQKIFKLGHLFEEWYGEKHPELDKESEVRFNVTDDVEFIGHIDYSDKDYLYELKSVTSKNTYREVFRKLKPKIQNVLQLTTYMVALERDKGKLIYGSFVETVQYDKIDEIDDDEFEEICETIKPDETVEFLIEVQEDGKFLCNKEELDLTVTDIVDFWNAAADMICDEEVPAKPKKLKPTNYFSPCHFCEMKNICAIDYDSWNEFYLTVKNFIASR